MEYTFVRFSPELIDDFRYIYEATQKRKLDIKYALKKFDTHYFGFENVGYIAYSSQKEPAAFYAVFPIKIDHHGESILAAQSGETMTHPDHRYNGLFQMLFKKTADLAEELGIKYFVGIPNQFSYRGLVKFGWDLQYFTKKYFIPIETSFWRKVIRKLSSNFVEKKRAKRFYDLTVTSKDLLKNIKQNSTDNFFIEHNELFFEYKSYSSSFIIKLENGYAWVKPDEGRFNLGDIFPKYENGYTDLLNEIKKLGSQLYYTEIVFFTSPNSKYNSIFADWHSAESLPFLTYKVDKEFVFDGKQIEFTYADFDTF